MSREAIAAREAAERAAAEAAAAYKKIVYQRRLSLLMRSKSSPQKN